MNVHLFGKVDSPSIANWTIKKNCSRPIWLLWPNFYQNHRKRLLHGRFLVFISWDFSCSKVCLDIINILKRGGFPIDQIYFRQSLNTSSFINEQCLSKINRNQPFCKRYTNRTNLGDIMEHREGYISYKIYSK